MNIYLDVDGVLLNRGKPANYLDEFITYLDKNHADNVYWLTTHCKGSTDAVLAYLKQFVDNEVTYQKMTRFKPTEWNTAKTQAVDFSKPFIWFDDNLFYNEKEELAENDASDNMILINLKKYPNTLQTLVHDFPLPIN